MRSLNTVIAAFALSLCAALTLPAQTTVSTVPVGFNTFTLPANASSVIANPFYQIANFQGAISASTSNTVSFTGTTFTSILTAPPYLARFKTGNSTGRFFAITSFTDTQLTLDTSATGGSGYTLTTSAPAAGSTQTQVAVGDSVEILPANTLNGLFPSGAPFLVGSTANAADNVLLFNGTSWETYFYKSDASPAQWRRSGSGLNQNNKVIFPDQGMFIVRRPGNSVNVTFMGTVPSTQEKTDFPGAGQSFKSTRFPVDLTFFDANPPPTGHGLNLQTLPGWKAGTTANAADNVLVWNGTSWSTYFYNDQLSPAQWRRSGSGLNQNTTVIPLGSAVFVVRQSTATGNTSTLPNQNLPYTL